MVEYVAGQVKVPASELGFYDWSGRSIEYHRVVSSGSNRRLTVRYERSANLFAAFLTLAVSLTCWKKLVT